MSNFSLEVNPSTSMPVDRAKILSRKNASDEFAINLTIILDCDDMEHLKAKKSIK